MLALISINKCFFLCHDVSTEEYVCQLCACYVWLVMSPALPLSCPVCWRHRYKAVQSHRCFHVSKQDNYILDIIKQTHEAASLLAQERQPTVKQYISHQQATFARGQHLPNAALVRTAATPTERGSRNFLSRSCCTSKTVMSTLLSASLSLSYMLSCSSLLSLHRQPAAAHRNVPVYYFWDIPHMTTNTNVYICRKPNIGSKNNIGPMLILPLKADIECNP